MPTLQPDLPKDQLDDARRYLIARLMPGKSKAGFASYPSMNAAGIQAIDEIMVVTQAIRREFAGSIYKQNGAFRFTRPSWVGWTLRPRRYRFRAARSGWACITCIPT
jgi:hypothetical protein